MSFGLRGPTGGLQEAEPSATRRMRPGTDQADTAMRGAETAAGPSLLMMHRMAPAGADGYCWPAGVTMVGRT